MQLPFVLQSAEVMKAAVALLEPHMENVSGEQARARSCSATVRGDVHDIGKNLVDIILTNNGYEVINLGIKQPIDDIIEAAEEHDADVIGMSRAAREVDGRDEGEPPGAELARARRSGGRSCSAAPPSPAPTSRTTSPAMFDGDGALRPRRVRGAARSWSRSCAIARGAAPDDVGLPALQEAHPRALCL